MLYRALAGCWKAKSGIRFFNVVGCMKLFYWKGKFTRKSRKNSGIGGSHGKVARTEEGTHRCRVLLVSIFRPLPKVCSLFEDGLRVQC